MYSHIQINLGQLSISLVNINLGQLLFWILRLGPHYRVNNWPIILSDWVASAHTMQTKLFGWLLVALVRTAQTVDY
jgi:hypothetical protein